MRREPQEIKQLVRQYEQKISEASIPLWMDAPDILDVLDHYEQKGLYFESEQCMRIALHLHPDNPEVIVRKAYRLKNEGRWSEAIEWVRRAPQQKGIDVLFFEAEYALSQLQFERAEQLFLSGIQSEYSQDEQDETPLEAQPVEQSALHLEMSELFMDYGSPHHAVKYLSMVQSNTPEYPRAQTLWAECEFQLANTEESLLRLNTLLDEDPYYLDAWILLADISNEIKNFEKCNEAAQFALAIDPSNEKALRFKAVANLALERFNEVLDIYETYRQLYPTDYTMALSAGEILMHQNRIEEARIVLMRSNQVCPNEHPDKQRILSDLALTYVAERRFSEAYEILLGCTSLGMSHAEVLLIMAQFCLNQRALPEAVHAFESYLFLQVLDDDTCLRIARMLVEANVFVEATVIWTQLFQAGEMRRTTQAAPYLALAARHLQHVREYFFWIAYASYEDPTLTKQLFKDIYPNVLPSEYIGRARAEYPDFSF